MDDWNETAVNCWEIIVVSCSILILLYFFASLWKCESLSKIVDWFHAPALWSNVECNIDHIISNDTTDGRDMNILYETIEYCAWINFKYVVVNVYFWFGELTNIEFIKVRGTNSDDDQLMLLFSKSLVSTKNSAQYFSWVTTNHPIWLNEVPCELSFRLAVEPLQLTMTGNQVWSFSC